jgi:hypothetical protein
MISSRQALGGTPRPPPRSGQPCALCAVWEGVAVYRPPKGSGSGQGFAPLRCADAAASPLTAPASATRDGIRRHPPRRRREHRAQSMPPRGRRGRYRLGPTLRRRRHGQIPPVPLFPSRTVSAPWLRRKRRPMGKPRLRYPSRSAERGLGARLAPSQVLWVIQASRQAF